MRVKSKTFGTGATIRQLAMREFLSALVAYEQALRSGDAAEVVRASLRIHAAKNGVPKKFHAAPGRIFRTTRYGVR